MEDRLSDQWKDREEARLRLMQLRVADDRSLARAIDRALSICAQAVGVDRVSVWMCNNDRGTLECVQLYDRRRPAGAPLPTLTIDDLGAYQRALHELRVLVAHDVADNEHSAPLVDQYFGPLSIRATLDAPIYRNGEVVGVVCHEHRDSTRRWTDADADFATSMADIIALMLTAADLHQAELRLREQEERLEQARRADALARMALGVAHDLNNMITVLLTSVGTLQRRASDPHTVLTVAADMREAAQGAARLTAQLLTYGRQGRGQPVRVDVDAQLAALHPALAPLATGRTLELAPGAPGAAIHVDPTQLESALHNLVANAREATAEGGHITLRTRVVGGQLQLDVGDDGRGMDAETRARCFEPFYSTTSSRTRGLGLALVQGVVESAGGHVEVETAPGRGACFRLVFPLAEPARGG